MTARLREMIDEHELLEVTARAIGESLGYVYVGTDSYLALAEINPRAAHHVGMARHVIQKQQELKR